MVAATAAAMGSLVLPLATAAHADVSTVTDSFDRADAGSLGATDSGHPWTSRFGSFSVSGNRALAGGGYSLSTVSSGAGDASVSVTVAQPSSEFWLIVRFDDPANYWRFGRSNGGPYQLQQVVGNNLGNPQLTVLGSASPSPGDRLECRSSSVLTCLVDDVPLVRTSDTFAAGAGAHGLGAWNGPTTSFDDFRVAPLPQLADLGVSVSGPAQVPGGVGVELTATVVNTGLAAAQDAAVVWSPPSGLGGVTGTGPGGDCVAAGSDLRCPVGDLAPGASATATLSAASTSGGGTVEVPVAATHDGTDAQPADNSATASFLLRPDLSAATVVSDGFGRADTTNGLGAADTGQSWSAHHGQARVAGSEAAFGSGYTLTTVGSGKSNGVVATTLRSTGQEFWLVLRLSSGADYWRFGRSGGGAYQLQQIVGNNLGNPVLDRRATVQAAAGDRLSCRLTDTVISCSVDGVVVVRTADGFNRGSGKHGLAAYASPGVRVDDFVVEKAVPQPDLSVSLDVPSLLASGTGTEVTATVRNAGTAAAGAATVTVDLPDGSSATSAAGPAGACAIGGTSVTCPLGSVAPQASADVVVQVTAPAATGTVRTAAEASASEPDGDPDDNTASASSVVYDASQPRPVLVDTFGRPDAGSLGRADTGQEWSALSGAFSVADGKASSGGGYALATVDAGQPDGSVAATVVQPGTEFWLVVRSAGAADYWRFGRRGGESYQLQLIRNNGLGTPAVTTLGTVQPAAGDRLECRVGTGLSCSVNGQPVVVTSDGTHATATRHGLGTWNSPGTVFDDFQVAELPKVPDVVAALTGTRSVVVSGQMALQATVSNAGTQAARDTRVEGTLPAGTTISSASTAAGSCAVQGRTFLCSVGLLGPGDQAHVDVSATAPGQAGPVTTTVQAVHDAADGDVSNDTASLTTTVRLPAPPGAVVQDGFDRPAPASGLGTTDSGEPWQALQGAFTIQGGEARAASATTSLAAVDAGFAFGTYEVTVTSGADAPFWLAFRVQDSGNHFRWGHDGSGGFYRLSKIVGGSEQQIYASNRRADVRPADGDVIRVVLRPDDGIYIFVNGELVNDAGDQALIDATGFGLRATSPSTRFDGFEVSSVVEGFPVHDTFSRPDSDDIGTPEQGTRYPWRSWSGMAWGIENGRAFFPGGDFGLTAIDATTEKAGVRATFSALSLEQYLVFRYAEDNSYYRFGAALDGTYAVQLVQGWDHLTIPVPVEVVSQPVVAPGDVVEVVQHLDGRVVTKVNGVVTHRFTDPDTNARATIYGLATEGAGARFDDFSITLAPR